MMTEPLKNNSSEHIGKKLLADLRPASRFKRFLAHLIDNFILWLLVWMRLGNSWGAIALLFIILYYYIGSFKRWFLLLVSLVLVGASSIGMAFIILYYSLLESSKHQATLGKRLFNLYVATTNGDQLSFLRSLTRCIIAGIPTLLYALSVPVAESFADVVWCIFALILFTPILFGNRRGLHDRLTFSGVYTRK